MALWSTFRNVSVVGLRFGGSRTCAFVLFSDVSHNLNNGQSATIQHINTSERKLGVISPSASKNSRNPQQQDNITRTPKNQWWQVDVFKLNVDATSNPNAAAAAATTTRLRVHNINNNNSPTRRAYHNPALKDSKQSNWNWLEHDLRGIFGSHLPALLCFRSRPDCTRRSLFHWNQLKFPYHPSCFIALNAFYYEAFISRSLYFEVCHIVIDLPEIFNLRNQIIFWNKEMNLTCIALVL